MKKLLILLLLLYNAKGLCQAPDSATFTEQPFILAVEGVKLCGTLTLPAKSNTQVPVVLIIPGSGSTDRDGNNISAGLKCDSYKQLAQALARQEISSLRYDKRGVGESKSPALDSLPRIYDTEVNDAKKLVSQLKSDKRFSRIIIAGHSQGALTGLLAAEKADQFISLCGIGQRGNEVLKEQLAMQPRTISEKANPIIDSLAQGHLVRDVPSYLMALFKPSAQPYIISWFRYDPAEVLSKLEIPSLIIQGDNDVQIKLSDAERLAASSSKAKLIIIKGMNHLLKQAPAAREQNLKTYSNPNLPIDGSMVNVIVRFILQR